MGGQRWLAAAGVLVACFLLTRATFLGIAALRLLDFIAEHGAEKNMPTVKLFVAIGSGNLILGLLAFFSGIAMWRGTPRANVHWFRTTCALMIGMMALILGTKVPWTDYFPEAILIAWSIAYFFRRWISGDGLR